MSGARDNINNDNNTGLLVDKRYSGIKTGKA
jgi:hypothetical protein